MAGLFQKPWPDEVKRRALLLSATLGVPEASARTGVPEGTISKWRQQLPKEELKEPPAAGTVAESEPAAAAATRPDLKRAAAEVFAQAQREVLPHVVGRLSRLHGQLCGLAEKSLRQWERVIDTAAGDESGKPRLLTLAEMRAIRTLIGSASQAMKQAYLAAGVPANRIEIDKKVTRREEFVGVVIDATRAREHVLGRIGELATRGRTLEDDSGGNRDN